jgi:hypothetical protein
MIRPRFCFLLMLSFFLRISGADAQDQPMHMDHPYVQDYSIKYVLNNKSFPEKITLKRVGCDRNGNVQVLSSKGILKNTDGQFLYPGELVMDLSYRPMLDKKISDLGLYQNQFVYLDGQAILSNAWAGKLYSTHSLPAATQFCAGDDFAFLVADDKTTHYVKDSKTLVSLTLDAPLVAMVFDQKRNGFWLLSEHGVSFFDVKSHTLRRRYKGSGFTCFSLANDNKELVIGTHNGYFTINPSTGAMLGEIKNKLPCNDLTVVK